MNGCVGWVVNLANIQRMEIDARADRGTRQLVSLSQTLLSS